MDQQQQQTMSQIKSQNNQNAQISGSSEASAPAPSEEAIRSLCDRTNCQIVQENGQRRFGPPPEWSGPPPNRGCEVFVGKIPRDCFEDELVPVFESVGPIYMFRLMMEFSGCNRGYGFCVYTNRDDTKRAVRTLDNYEVRKGKSLGVCLSVDNCRLFVGGIPKNKTKQDIMQEMRRVTEGVTDVIVYPSATNKEKNRGFAFVEYEHHKAAAMARRKLIPGRIQLWDQQIAVDWAEPEREVDEDIMAKVKILYVRNLMLDTTEDHLRELFAAAAGEQDCVERVKKIRDYAFVHFKERSQALEAMAKINDTQIDGSRVEVSLAKPAEKGGDPNRQAARGIVGLGGLGYNKAAAPSLNGFAGATPQPAIAPMPLPPPPPPQAAPPTLAAAGHAMPIAYNLIGPQPGLEPLTLAYCSQLIGPPHGAAMSPRLITAQAAPNGLYLAGPDSPKIQGVGLFNVSVASNGMGGHQQVGQSGQGGGQRRVFRNAAGSRSAGARNNANLLMQQQHQQHQQQHQLRLKKGNVEQHLDDLCVRNGFGGPSYQVQCHELLDPSTGAQSSWFLGRVTLGGSPTAGIPPRQFSASRFTQTTEDAKSAAAESALLQLWQLPAAAGGFGVSGSSGFHGPDPTQAAFVAAAQFSALPFAAGIPNHLAAAASLHHHPHHADGAAYPTLVYTSAAAESGFIGVSQQQQQQQQQHQQQQQQQQQQLTVVSSGNGPAAAAAFLRPAVAIAATANGGANGGGSGGGSNSGGGVVGGVSGGGGVSAGGVELFGHHYQN